ncbi:MAG: hypothetical protein MUP17_06720 [candidate division Zixibacteria bacterium]|nr:hypothetical protein [candidate division Zixibacteria bacterium]
MMKKPFVINDLAKIEAVRNASLEYLENNEGLYEKIATHLWAYHEIGVLVPQTPENFMSGHFFPYSESYYELENSYALCLEGFYTYAFVALRSVLELGVLGIYFAVNDQAHMEVQPWLDSEERTPRFGAALDRLKSLENFALFNRRFDLVKRILEIYDNLSGFVHTRGFSYSSTAHTRSNFNQFSVDTLNRYSNTMFSVVSNSIISMLLKYPIGMQPLPVVEKFGLNIPMGGFLEGDQVDIVTSVIKPEEKVFLKNLSDGDPDVRQIVEYFESLSDLSEEDWKRQIEEFDKEHPQLRKKNKDGS